MAAAIGFERHEYGVDFGQRLWVVTLQNPSFARNIVFVEYPQIKRLQTVRAAPAPGLKRRGSLGARLLIQIIGIKDEGLSARVEDAAVGLLRFPVAGNIVNLSNVQIARPHQLSNITIVREQLILLLE